MHDPMTVALEIRRPWPQHMEIMKDGSRWRYWPSLVTIWHVDPERDGLDDSCGWSYPRITKAQMGQLSWLAGCEARSPWLQREPSKEPSSPADAEARLRGAFLAVARQLRIRLTFNAAALHAAEFLHSPADNCRSMLCHLPGWHTNFSEDSEDRRKDEALRLFVSLARILLRERRPWWRHPRWHLWHWKIQIHPLQDFKRWAFSRCATCGGRFRWAEAPTSTQWHGTGPRWLRSEEHVHHSACAGSAAANAVQPEPGPAAPTDNRGGKAS